MRGKAVRRGDPEPRAGHIYDWHEREGFSPDEIATQFPRLTLADVDAALSYDRDHREAIERARKEDRDFLGAMETSIPSKLVQRIEVHPRSLPPLGSIREGGRATALRFTLLWIHRNRPGTRDLWDGKPLLLTLEEGIAVYSDDGSNHPRLPSSASGCSSGIA
jgi:hypothetical protein